MFNPFLMTKQNYAPTFMIVPQPQKKSISILPIEEEKIFRTKLQNPRLNLKRRAKFQ